MPIDSSKFKDAFLKRMDPNDPDYIGMPDTEQKAIDLWAEGLADTCQGIIPSAPTAGAKSAFEAAAVGMSNTTTGGATLVAACNAFASTLAGAMVGYVPASIPVFVLTDLTLTSPSSDVQVAAATIAAQIEIRLKTGISNLAVPPNTPQPWT